MLKGARKPVRVRFEPNGFRRKPEQSRTSQSKSQQLSSSAPHHSFMRLFNSDRLIILVDSNLKRTSETDAFARFDTVVSSLTMQDTRSHSNLLGDVGAGMLSSASSRRYALRVEALESFGKPISPKPPVIIMMVPPNMQRLSLIHI